MAPAMNKMLEIKMETVRKKNTAKLSNVEPKTKKAIYRNENQH